MTTIFIILFTLSLIVTKHEVGSITVTEVNAGHLAELPCLSSDDHHRFMFWQLTDDKQVIGPGNRLDNNKYNYEVLTGKLYIRGVSTAESGFYKCVSRGIADNSAINVHVVELVVKKDWSDTENDFETSLLRGMVAAMLLVLIVALVLLALTNKRKRSHRFLEMDDSREASPAKYNENVQVTAAIPMPTTTRTDGVDNAGLDVDFPKVFTQMQKEQAIP